MLKNSKKINVRRTREIHFRVTETEEMAIKKIVSALMCNQSQYLRSAALAYEVKTKADLEAIRMLFKINGDQGRLGGLLKLLLSEVETGDFNPNEIRNVLAKIEATQEQLRTLLWKIAK